MNTNVFERGARFGVQRLNAVFRFFACFHLFSNTGLSLLDFA